MKNMGRLLLDGQEVIPHCLKAVTFFSRFLGLMGKKSIKIDQAILFPKCNSIHTFFMRFSIDVIFISQDGHITEVVPELKKWRLLFPRRGADSTLELSGGNSVRLGISKGKKIEWVEA